MKTTITLYIKPKQTQKLKSNKRIPGNKNPIKIAYKKKGKKKI